MEKDLGQEQLNIIYLIVNFLVIPFNKEYSNKIEILLGKIQIIENRFSNDLILSLKEICEKNVNSLKDFKKEGEYDYITNPIEFRYKLIKKFSVMVINIDFYHGNIYEILSHIFLKIDCENKSYLLDIIDYYHARAIDKSKQLSQEESNKEEIKREVLQVILKDIYFSYKNLDNFNRINKETLKMNLKNKELEDKLLQNKKTVDYLTKTLVDISSRTNDIKSLKDDIIKMEEDVKKNSPIVQLSTFGIFITMIISSVGIFKVTDISFHMLFNNTSQICNALLLLLVATLSISSFVYVMQLIFFKGAEKEPLSFSNIVRPSIIIAVLISVIIFLSWLINNYFMINVIVSKAL